MSQGVRYVRSCAGGDFRPSTGVVAFVNVLVVVRVLVLVLVHVYGHDGTTETLRGSVRNGS